MDKELLSWEKAEAEWEDYGFELSVLAELGWLDRD